MYLPDLNTATTETRLRINLMVSHRDGSVVHLHYFPSRVPMISLPTHVRVLLLLTENTAFRSHDPPL